MYVRRYLAGIAIFLAPCAGRIANCSAEAEQTLRSVTVADAIGMTRLGVPNDQDDTAGNEVATFSPDHKLFAIVLKRGNLSQNTNDYSLFVLKANEALRGPKTKALLTMCSSSNREGIKDLKWLDDDTLIFIGERGSEPSQLYRFHVATGRLERITSHATAILKYDVSADGRTIVFQAERPVQNTVDTEETRHEGLAITSQSLNELLLARAGGYRYLEYSGNDLFLKRGTERPIQVPVADRILPMFTVSVSPNGHYALIEVFTREVPEIWRGYKDRLLHTFVVTHPQRGTASSVERFLLLDTRTGDLSPVFDAPKPWEHDGFAWICGGTSIVFSDAYLPLDGVDEMTKRIREERKFVAEVRLPSREITVITEEPVKVTRWIPKNGKILLDNLDRHLPVRTRVYKKEGANWVESSVSPEDLEEGGSVLLTYEQGLNQPPQIFATDSKNGRKVLLMDLNPGFKHLEFGKVEAVHWKATDGHGVDGGLYLPPNYEPGQKYPLVIQTHAFDSNRFWIDGPWSSAFAAQPLASKGMVVLQVGNGEGYAEFRSTPLEAPRQMAAFEGAIDYLDQRGLVDRNRVGIIGFSRTVYHVAYTLTHSKYHFAAATLADGYNAGYLESIIYTNSGADPEAVNGGPPYGSGLALWLKNSPEFNIDKVETPVRIESYGLGSITEEWEWFSLLTKMEKPVDFILLPRGTHLLVKPLERMVSQQGNVDWFDFWLRNEEDPNPVKKEEYARWRALKRGFEESLPERN